MPVHQSHDKFGSYLQYGDTGKKYYYYDVKTKEKAYEKCIKQMRAIKSHQKK